MKFPLAPAAVFCVFVNTAAEFQKVTLSGMKNVASISSTPIAWADFDNDNDLDLVVTGSTYTGLWRNNQGVFSRVTIQGMPSVSESSVAWGDYDNDGRVDLLIVGLTIVGASTVNVSQLWRNTDSGFVQVPVPGLPGVFTGSAAWVDFDRDGLLDFSITGSRTFLSGPLVSELWRNTGTGFAKYVVEQLPGTKEGNISWGDYDADGFPDFLVAGSINPEFGANPNPLTQLWRNTTMGFERVLLPGFTAMSGSSRWADFDNDGMLDFVIAGSERTELWRQAEAGFEKLPLPGIIGVFGPVIPADYNHDGWEDLFVTGGILGETYTRLWRNTGAGFEFDPVTGLTELGVAAVAWGDYNNDGRLDFFQTGYDGNSEQLYFSQLWRNTTQGSNSPPTAPAGLSAIVGSEVRLQWSPSSDGTNATESLTYNLRVGRAPGSSDVVSPAANVATGFRRIPAAGNAGYLTNAVLRLPPGRYYWSVQAVDAGFSGGPFSPEAIFLTGATLTIARNESDLVLTWSAESGYILEETTHLSAGWEPSNRGDQPIVIAGPGPQRFFRLRRP